MTDLLSMKTHVLKSKMNYSTFLCYINILFYEYIIEHRLIIFIN